MTWILSQAVAWFCLHVRYIGGCKLIYRALVDMEDPAFRWVKERGSWRV